MRTVALSSSRYFLKGFSEQEIIALQDAFLTNGIHEITVSNVNEGRSLIETFVRAINYHRNIACLTLEPLSLEPAVLNVYRQLRAYDQIDTQTLFDFFLDQFSSDLLFIENTNRLMETDWFLEFQQQVIDFKLETSIPIISLSYCQKGN